VPQRISATAGCRRRRDVEVKLTGIAPSEITDTFGVDAFRYYFMRAIDFRAGRLLQLGGSPARYQSGARQRLPAWLRLAN
jgi:hypothetical protein